MALALAASGAARAEGSATPLIRTIPANGQVNGSQVNGIARAVLPPTVLGEADSRRYRRIFALQEKGRWGPADHEIRKLKDRLLMGHVMAQRYLHPTRYRSRYSELAGWMKRYADHPEARRIYKLAMKRKPKRARAPRRAKFAQRPRFEEYSWDREVTYTSPKRRSKARKREVRRLIRKIRYYARSGRLTVARRTLKQRHTQHVLDSVELDIARAYIGAGYFFRGTAKMAYRFAGPAASRSGRHMSFANWYAGLAAYRLGEFKKAAVHFEAMANSGKVTGWNSAAAAFWAARANMVARQPERVTRWLEAATRHPRTFYGLLAARVLGIASPYNWDLPSLEQTHIAAIMRRPAGKRALALLQVGRTVRAEHELRSLTALDDRVLGEALLAFADAARLPALALNTAAMVSGRDGPVHHGALYPVPVWRPKEGFTVDRAVVYAFMRQESRFNTRAKSNAGARGLMQLMPATAGFIAKRRFRGRRRNQLYEPALNLSLGQKYLRHLIAHDLVKGDMLLVAAAYNGGPGNLAKWRRRAQRRKYLDPLLFIESIPARETRIFIERVLANIWMYRQRLGQEAPSLDALAAGATPFYKSLDRFSKTVASNVRN